MQYILVNYVRAASATELEIKTVKGAYLDLITTQSFFFLYTVIACQKEEGSGVFLQGFTHKGFFFFLKDLIIFLGQSQEIKTNSFIRQKDDVKNSHF